MLMPARTASGETLADFRLVQENKAILQSSALKEASGMAVSSRDDRLLWIINDSGAAPEFHLMETDGTYRGKATLTNARNVDWEDLVSFTMDGNAWLMAADTGDNTAKRETCTLYVAREPDAPAAGKSLDAATRIAWEIRFRYEDGPRDCESVAVDAQAGKILLISKRTEPPVVYELPLKPTDGKPVQVARRIGETRVSAPMDSLIPFRDEPTGLDITPDQSLAAVVTYYGVFLFPRKPGESWAEAFSRKPASPAPHLLPQAESVAFSKDRKSLFVVSEGKASKIVRYQKQERE